MSEDWSVPGWGVLALVLVLVAVLVLAAVVVGTSLARSRRRTAAALAEARAARTDADALHDKVDAIERRLARQSARPASVEEREYVITHLGEEPDDEPGSQDATPAVPVVSGPLFADLVLREGVVQAASLAAGVRRALAPEMRHRIRFEMRREVKRARKQRRADQREARRQYEARRRAESPAA